MWMLVHPTHLVLSSATLSNKIFCVYFWSKILLFLYFCACHNSKMNFIPQTQEQKVVEGKLNVLVHYVDISAISLFDVVPYNPFKWDILWFIFEQKSFFCVPTTLAKQILFHNHRNKKLVGGIYNVLVHYMDASAPDPSGIVLCNTWNEIFCGSFWSKISLFVCLPH